MKIEKDMNDEFFMVVGALDVTIEEFINMVRIMSLEKHNINVYINHDQTKIRAALSELQMIDILEAIGCVDWDLDFVDFVECILGDATIFKIVAKENQLEKKEK